MWNRGLGKLFLSLPEHTFKIFCHCSDLTQTFNLPHMSAPLASNSKADSTVQDSKKKKKCEGGYVKRYRRTISQETSCVTLKSHEG